MAHDSYRLPGGEEHSFRLEAEMLRERGHDVVTYTRSNEEIHERRLTAKLKLASDTIWSRESYTALVGLIRRHRPQIAHFQNTFPLISPAAYYACKDEGVPVVQTLRNYRLICPNALLLRDGRICRDCVGKAFAWPGILHACYRDSRAQSATVATMVAYHRARDTWGRQVDAYIALTETARQLFVEGGLPGEKIFVKPNGVADPGMGGDAASHVAFVGRLSQEKGVRVLLEAWGNLRDVPLRIIGDGPMAGFVRRYIDQNHLNAVLLGHRSQPEVFDEMRGARFVVFPSLCFETFGRTIVEAYACGKPVIGTGSGTALELISDGKTGLHFTWGDAADLARKVRQLWSDPSSLARMSTFARQEYLQKYTPDSNYAALMLVYEKALSAAAGRS